jgi:hypothetical protein
MCCSSAFSSVIITSSHGVLQPQFDSEADRFYNKLRSEVLAE